MGSLRLRLTLLATALVLGVLIAGASLLYGLQRSQLTDSVDRSLTERADTIAALFGESGLPPSFGADDEDRAVQVVDGAGNVVAASRNLRNAGPIANLDVSLGERIRTTAAPAVGEDDFRILSRRITTAEGGFVLHVAESTDDLEDNSESLLATLAAAVPFLAALLAGLIWWLVGRTLRPVDTMRSEVDAISDTQVAHQLVHPGRNDEIGRLATTLNQMLHRLHRSSEQQRQFVADAAHELRTPLTRLRTTVEVDIAQPDAADPERTNREVRAEVLELQRLIDDLLHLANSDDGSASDYHAMLDLDDLVMAEIREQRRATPHATVGAANVSACEITGDEAQIRRAFRNLLTNAIRHAHARVEVTLEQNPSGARLLVDDDGPGVDPDQREAVFDRFTRLDEARSVDQGGAGLGLAITRDIVTRHGGTVRCEPSPLGGARFVATFGHPADGGPDEPDPPPETGPLNPRS